ncbi:MAG: hypothetical protein EA409_07045 [Saprospirales bacterium]|nr:MAG: hypothetical protein EA409_07045 [Saprospirales bacterium]
MSIFLYQFRYIRLFCYGIFFVSIWAEIIDNARLGCKMRKMIEKETDLTRDKRFWIAMLFIMVFLLYLLANYP